MPTPTFITPNSGPTNGGTIVSINGSGFEPGADVLFGGSLATNISVSSGGSLITCTTPARSAGLCDVVVVNPDGQSGSLPSAFSFNNPAPVISSVNPPTGPTAGGTNVTIAGANFLTGATVTFGGASASNVSVTGGTTITCTTPSNSSGAYDVIVINPDGKTATRTGGFVYSDPAPTIATVSPSSGGTAGGTMVTISGANFLDGGTVNFGGMPATNVVITGGTTITCSSPPNASGGYDVIVTNPDGQSATLAGGFIYSDPVPIITSVAPTTGPTAGGTSVTIAGTSFVAGATVYFGGNAATNVIVTGGTTITCITPANASGGCDVIVVNPDGQSATLAGGFIYSDPVPTITSVTPGTGPTAGGTVVTIAGNNFLPGASVSFGGNAATNVTVSGGNTVTCHSPANPSGGCDVIVVNPDGQSATLAGGFVYSDPVPAIASITPSTGPTAGGTAVTIDGNNFLPGATVSFGSVPAANVVVASGNTVTCDAPPNSAGGYDVIVTNPDGQSATLAGGFVYNDPSPVIGSLTPPTGTTAGGTAVSISGTNFLPGATVSFGATLATNVVVTGATTINCDTPPNISGGYDVIVTNPDGQSATLAGGFVYNDPVPVITAVNPPTGPTAGGTAVTITGTNFLTGATVNFGAAPATNVVITGGTTITCSTPANLSGGYDVIVTNPGGQSATRSGGFVYSDPPPTISSVMPSTGPTDGGTSVTISGTNFLPGATVNFGAVPATNITVVAGNTITCDTPTNSPGGCDVTVINPDGKTATQSLSGILVMP